MLFTVFVGRLESQSELDTLSEQARQGMDAELEKLPNYVCKETIERSVIGLAKNKTLFRDRVHLEVAFIQGVEMFSWPGSGSFDPDLFKQLPRAGISGPGGFGGWTRALFGAAAPDFTSAGECTVEGRHGVQYGFRVPVASSRYQIHAEGHNTLLPYAGSFCVDPGSKQIMLLRIRAEQTPPPVTGISESIRYERTRIGSTDFLLPVDHELVATDIKGNENRTTTRFTACREYVSESTIRFGEEPVDALQPDTKKTETLEIPAGIFLILKLETPITFEESAVGDPITARLDRAVKFSGESIPKGSIATGRIRGLEEFLEPQRSFLVALDFSSLTFAGNRARFRGRLAGPRPRSLSPMAGESGVHLLDSATVNSGFVFDQSSHQPGAFRVFGSSLRLDRGLRMIWATSAPSR